MKTTVIASYVPYVPEKDKPWADLCNKNTRFRLAESALRLLYSILLFCRGTVVVICTSLPETIPNNIGLVLSDANSPQYTHIVVCSLLTSALGYLIRTP